MKKTNIILPRFDLDQRMLHIIMQHTSSLGDISLKIYKESLCPSSESGGSGSGGSGGSGSSSGSGGSGGSGSEKKCKHTCSGCAESEIPCYGTCESLGEGRIGVKCMENEKKTGQIECLSSQ